LGVQKTPANKILLLQHIITSTLTRQTENITSEDITFIPSKQQLKRKLSFAHLFAERTSISRQ